MSAHPEVTHNYLRDAELNLWFTAIAPSDAHLDAMIDAIFQETGIEVLNLPVTALYKIRVDFGKASCGQAEAPSSQAETPSGEQGAPFDAHDPFEVALVRWAQASR